MRADAIEQSRVKNVGALRPSDQLRLRRAEKGRERVTSPLHSFVVSGTQSASHPVQ
jgi:hypothetical protein